MTDEVEVWLDADFLERTRVGTLSHDRGTLRFVYEPEWLKDPQAFALDPDLSLGDGTYFPNAEAGNFRVFDDSAPDRWGQTLMKRREALAAKDESRKPKTLYAWDFLLGVEDVSRQGALRYRRPDEEAFLAHEYFDGATGRESQGAREPSHARSPRSGLMISRRCASGSKFSSHPARP